MWFRENSQKVLLSDQALLYFFREDTFFSHKTKFGLVFLGTQGEKYVF